MSNYNKRLAAVEARTYKAVRLFEKLEQEFTLAAGEDREIWDELQSEIDRLTALQGQAQDRGRRNEARAQRLREFFL